MYVTCNPISVLYQANIQSLISCVVKWLNVFPTKGVISKTMSPSMIVELKPDPYFNQESIMFGSYDLVYTGKINNTNRRIIPLISQKNQMITEDIV